MSLAASQRAFVAEITADDDAAAPSSLGLEIYRNAYRARLLGVLEVSFERTKRWVGDDMFTAAACHYIIAQPSQSWTLDCYGDQFPDTLVTLFAQDREVAELAWLEWHLQQAFAAPDLPELSAAGLAQAGLGDADWERVCFTMAAGYAARSVSHDCTGLWQALRDHEPGDYQLQPTEPGVLVVWRTALRPHYRVLERDEFAALNDLATGGTFGGALALAGTVDPAQFGTWFAQWLSEGLFAGFATSGQTSV